MRVTLPIFAPFLAITLLGAAVSPVHAATYQFDLSALLEGEGDLPQGLAVDLGTKFSQIESATLKLDGIFTPGEFVLVPAGDPPIFTGPPLDFHGLVLPGPVGKSMYMVMVGASLGDEPSPSLSSPAQGWWQSDGLTGSVQAALPLRAPGMSTLVPSPTEPGDYGFLLDGEFNLSMMQLHMVPFTGEFGGEIKIEPGFELSGLVLEVSGTAVPEPASAALIAAACGLAIVWRRRARRSLQLR